MKKKSGDSEARERAIQANNVEKMLTKVALDSVLPHANENCETRTTLAESTKGIKKKVVRKKSTSVTRTRLRVGKDLNCTYRVADNCDTATRKLPCCKKWATEPMASTDHFFSSHRSVKQRRDEKK